MVYGIISLLLAFGGFAALYHFRSRIPEKAMSLAAKVAGYALLVLLNVNYLFTDSFPLTVTGEIPRDVLTTLIRWVLMFADVLVITASIVNTKTMRTLMFYVAMPLSALSMLYAGKLISYYTAPMEKAYTAAAWLRITAFIVMAVLRLIVPLIYHYILYPGERPAKQDTVRLVKFFCWGFASAMPFLTLGSLFGATDIIVDIGHPLQLGWVVAIFAALAGLTLCYRKENEAERRSIVAFLTVYLFMHHNSQYVVSINAGRLPIQLCNLASYLLLILILIKSQKFFDFILVANCPGCVIAIATVIADDGLFSFWGMHYFVQHTIVFILPLLMVSLGLFKVPRFGEGMKHFLVGYNIYFFSCLLLNGLCNGVLKPRIGGFFNSTNYFYLRDCPITDTLPKLSADLLCVPFDLFGMRFYLAYVCFIYVVFIAISALFFELTRGIAKLGNKLSEKKAHPAA